MRSLLLSRITVVWFVLVAATALSWQIGHGMAFAGLQHPGIAILVVAFVKVRFVVLDFMELRNAPLFMRLVSEVLIVAICSLLIALYVGVPVLCNGKAAC